MYYQLHYHILVRRSCHDSCTVHWTTSTAVLLLLVLSYIDLLDLVLQLYMYDVLL